MNEQENLLGEMLLFLARYAQEAGIDLDKVVKETFANAGMKLSDPTPAADQAGPTQQDDALRKDADPLMNKAVDAIPEDNPLAKQTQGQGLRQNLPPHPCPRCGNLLFGADDYCLRCFTTTSSLQQAPHTCPVCTGSGKVSRPPWVAGDQSTWSGSTTFTSYTCRACQGSGVVWR
jgi:hypothetical protein